MDSINGNIAAFWKWFVEHSSELAAPSVSGDLIAQLEERLFSVHRLDWEIGPGRVAPSLFALSPRGDKQTLQLTQHLIKQAPKLKGWEFHSTKPPRKWDLVFSLNVNGKDIKIDGKGWEFVIYKFQDGVCELDFKPDDNHGLSDEYLNWAATIITDGELGEEVRMKVIEKIEIVTSWDKKTVRLVRKLEPGVLGKLISQ